MSKKAAYGTQLRYTDPDDSSLVRVHYVADITGPGINVETIDVTTHDSPDAFSEFVAGMADGADVSFDLIFDAGPAGHQRLLDLMDDRITMTWSLLLPRPETQVLLSPEFQNSSDWVGGGAWDTTGGQASIFAGTPTETDALSQFVEDLTTGEIYRLEIVFEGECTGGLEVSHDGSPIGTFDPTGKSRQILEWIPEQTEGDLAFTATDGPASMTVRSIRLYGLNNPDEERFDFTGMLTAVGVIAPVKDALKASATIKISGKPEFTPGT
jgi:hypothetical protein